MKQSAPTVVKESSLKNITPAEHKPENIEFFIKHIIIFIITNDTKNQDSLYPPPVRFEVCVLVTIY